MTLDEIYSSLHELKDNGWIRIKGYDDIRIVPPIKFDWQEEWGDYGFCPLSAIVNTMVNKRVPNSDSTTIQEALNISHDFFLNFINAADNKRPYTHNIEIRNKLLEIFPDE